MLMSGDIAAHAPVGPNATSTESQPHDTFVMFLRSQPDLRGGRLADVPLSPDNAEVVTLQY
ncbi:hypothetical protein CC2G_001376 [Coprinopsis cinerea AmutBmut pab1-1]|nr:hypothetical protein CC2G_001373 [Coprinopsis cinerea AmutBmut pab1-1]KAG2023756.1 hypothetical protein CC2G_001374 [Coprinopsis cinerea AmutBmut pab1-1]KAG2023757.1 hypothetical protein CC2G_001375 [Coprinopsis cinerea AmutBmut pab1-1]KAG2023758.1 hypothetical protein CC2G_001376 [Coprinopsis cinerea AmutBmut pab1-1]